MWCTRWFLPLVILPLPTAPPYFLAMFLVSMFLHARPCFYCMMVLTALFTSSCYWQAVPVDAPLTRPLGNATTFGEAIRMNLSLPDPDTVELPPVVQLLDRCWCNVFSRNGFFVPTDVSAWELASVEHARREIEALAARAKEAENESSREKGSVAESPRGTRGDKKEKKKEVMLVEEESVSAGSGPPFSFRALRDLLFPTMTPPSTPKYRLKTASSPTPVATSSSETPLESSSPRKITPQGTQARDPDSHMTDPAPSATDSSKLLRPYYDLRPYGLDITLDFRWNRQ